jgi:hypothetical protein
VTADLTVTKKQNEIKATTLLWLFGLLFDIPPSGIKWLLFGHVYALTYLV